MVRILIFLSGIAALISSCCFVRPTSAQSDRLETRNPFVPVVECVPCSTLRNSPELNLWAEAWGTNGKFMIGIEPGYNANNLRIYADAGTYLWPSGNMKFSHREQLGIVLLNPDFTLRPEIGVGLHQRFYRNGMYLTTTSGQVFQPEAPDYFWNCFAGLRINIPYSNMVVSTKVYRLQNFEDNRPDWNFGLQFACRL